MLYRYNMTTLSGTASGVLAADNEDDLKEILNDVYVTDFQDKNGKTVEDEIVELDITETGEL